MNTVSIYRVTRNNSYLCATRTTKLWIVEFEDGSQLDSYPTKKAARADARKYGLNVK